MRSFTSSSKREFKVILTVLAVMLSADLGIRLQGQRFSSELRALASLPQQASTLCKMDQTRMLILGNSLTNCGLDQDAFKGQAASCGWTDLAFEVVAFNGAEMCEWLWMFRMFFVEPGRLPDLVLVNATPPGLCDVPDVRIARLVTYCGARMEVLRDGHFDFGQRAEYLHASLSASCVQRARGRQIILQSIVPDYIEMVAWSHTLLRRSLDVASPSSQDDTSHHRLGLFASLAQQHGVKPILVLMPRAQPYELPQDLLDTIERTGVGCIDCREIEGLSPASYTDQHHLNADGARIFSRYLASRLARERHHWSSDRVGVE